MCTGAVYISPMTYHDTQTRVKTPCDTTDYIYSLTFEPVTIIDIQCIVMDVLASEVGTHPCTIMGIAVSRRPCPVCTGECNIDRRGSREREKSASKEKPSVHYIYLRLRKCQYE